MTSFGYVGEVLRRRGGTATAHTSDRDHKCLGCGGTIRTGTQFSLGSFASSLPTCFDCEPYDRQLSLLEELDEPMRGRRTPAEIREYECGKGVFHGSECKHCKNGKVVRPDGKKESCAECGGTGREWVPGAAGVE